MGNDSIIFWSIYAISGTVLVVASVMFWLTNPSEETGEGAQARERRDLIGTETVGS